MAEHLVVVGGGQAAAQAVQSLRAHNFAGPITLVCDEPHPPYQRPPLSKKLWAGGSEEKIWRGTEETGAELLLGRRIVSLDLSARRVVDDEGSEHEWEKLLARLRSAIPHFLTLGPYDAAHRSGPAIWLRCVLAGKIAEVALPAGTVPIIYLPGVSRATLRATDDCPQELKPLAELQYRGVIWCQANAKDWTLAAFLQAGLLVPAQDEALTVKATRSALAKLDADPSRLMH